MSNGHLTHQALRSASRELEGQSPSEILSWGFDQFGERIALATGFGPSGIVLLHLVSEINPSSTVFYLDTGFLFAETYRLRDRLEQRLGLQFTRVSTGVTPEEQEARHGPQLWEREPDRCCNIRKVKPLRQFMALRDAWITGIRRDQATTRKSIDIVSWDAANSVVKLCPLANWTAEDVWSYIRLNDLPYNPLHDKGFPSIGCTHCTRAAGEGDEVEQDDREIATVTFQPFAHRSSSFPLDTDTVPR